MKVNEIFYSVQGEGFHAGRAALFFRLPFCNLSCSWCDTEFDSYTEVSIDDIRQEIKSCPARFAVITGGEPSMNKDLPAVIDWLKSESYEIAMESNGQFLAPNGIDFLTVSPKRWTTKTGKDGEHPAFYIHPDNRPSEIKLVVDDEDVFAVARHLENEWRQGRLRFREESRPLFFLSPEWNQRERYLPLIIEFVKANPRWRISLQTHKILEVR